MEMGEPQTSQHDPTPGETDQMPVVPYRILYTDVPFYSDQECQNEVPDARIVVLEALDPDDSYRELDIVPSRTRYEPGQLVDWNLNNRKQWEENWFRHPETQTIEPAWQLHVEFTGRLISKRTLEENKEKLEKIESRLVKQKQ
jgi:hypothetical protein